MNVEAKKSWKLLSHIETSQQLNFMMLVIRTIWANRQQLIAINKNIINDLI